MKNNILIYFLIICISLVLFSCNKRPDQPVNISPVDGSTNISDKNLVLSWSCTDEDGDKLVYDLFLSDNPDGMITDDNLVVSNYENTSYTVSNLKNNTKYYWEVSAKDEKEKFSIGVWKFTTGIIEN